MTEVVVRPGEPDEYTIPFTHGWERRQGLGRMRRLRVAVDREEAKAANLNAKVDRIELPGIDTVRLTDIQTGGAPWVLVGYSAEWDANRSGYTTGGEVREGTDDQLVSDLVGDVATWTAGDIQSLSGPLSFVFSHAAPHEALRRIETNVSGEIRFRDFGTVDYVPRLGTDRTGEVTLSAGERTIEQEITITERGRELDGTHIRVLGAHEGEAQLVTNLIPEADTSAQAEYDNVVTYSTPRWTEEADTDWDRWSDKDITDQETLETEAAALGEELTDPLVKAETVVPADVELSIGDTVRVVKDDADLDRAMRVHRLTRSVGEFNDAESDAAVLDAVQLSTRTTFQKEDDHDLERLRKFDTGFQGSSVVITPGPFGKAVDAGNPLRFKFRYPAIEYENAAELNITGLPYRIDSQGAASGGGAFVTSRGGGTNDDTTASGGAEVLSSGDGGAVVKSSGDGGGFSETETSQAQSEHGSPDSNSDNGLTSVVGSTAWQEVASPVVSEFDVEGMFGGVYFRVADPFFDGDVRFRINVGNGDSYWPTQDGARAGAAAAETDAGDEIPANGAASAFAPVEDSSYDLEVLYDGASGEAFVSWWYTALGDHSHDVTISRPDHVHEIDIPDHVHKVDIPSHQHQFDWLHSHDVDVPDHVHDPQPGIYTTADTPSGVDVSINGTEVATNIGTGTFETTVDVAGDLTPGAWNTVEVSSGTLGIVEVSGFISGYDQIGKQ